jgi:hypothetical protein
MNNIEKRGDLLYFIDEDPLQMRVLLPSGLNDINKLFRPVSKLPLLGRFEKIDTKHLRRGEEVLNQRTLSGTPSAKKNKAV